MAAFGIVAEWRETACWQWYESDTLGIVAVAVSIFCEAYKDLVRIASMSFRRAPFINQWDFQCCAGQWQDLCFVVE